VTARLASAVLGLAVGVALSGCGGPERSAGAYCAKYQSGFAQIKAEYPEVDQYSHSDENPLVMLISVVGASGDIVALIGDMAEVAPDEIQTDVERVHETLEDQLGSAGDIMDNPLGALANGLMKGIVNSGAFSRMDAYTLEHCGEHMFSASPQ